MQQSPSKLSIVEHGSRQYKILAIDQNDSSRTIINTALTRETQYKTNDTFHQWSDKRILYGLKFEDLETAQSFLTKVNGVVEELKSIPAEDPPAASTPASGEQPKPTGTVPGGGAGRGARPPAPRRTFQLGEYRTNESGEGSQVPATQGSASASPTIAPISGGSPSGAGLNARGRRPPPPGAGRGVPPRKPDEDGGGGGPVGVNIAPPPQQPAIIAPPPQQPAFIAPPSQSSHSDEHTSSFSSHTHSDSLSDALDDVAAMAAAVASECSGPADSPPQESATRRRPVALTPPNLEDLGIPSSAPPTQTSLRAAPLAPRRSEKSTESLTELPSSSSSSGQHQNPAKHRPKESKHTRNNSSSLSEDSEIQERPAYQRRDPSEIPPFVPLFDPKFSTATYAFKLLLKDYSLYFGSYPFDIKSTKSIPQKIKTFLNIVTSKCLNEKNVMMTQLTFDQLHEVADLKSEDGQKLDDPSKSPLLSDMLRCYYKNLPKYLNTDNFDPSIPFSQLQGDEQKEKKFLQDLVASIPVPNREVIQSLMFTLNAVLERSQVNGTSLNALAIIYGPYLFRYQDLDYCSAKPAPLRTKLVF